MYDKMFFFSSACDGVANATPCFSWHLTDPPIPRGSTSFPTEATPTWTGRLGLDRYFLCTYPDVQEILIFCGLTKTTA